MNAIPVFFDPRQSVTENQSFSPSAGKPLAVVESWIKTGTPVVLKPFTAATPEDIALAHAPSYVEDILSCRAPNGFGNTNEGVAKALPWVVGSMVAATLHALAAREPSFSATSGAHHAKWSQAAGFCTFNFLIVAALKALAAGARKVAIIDVDCHHGDGTVAIINHLKLQNISHYSFGMRGPASRDQADDWLDRWPRILDRYRRVDLILYNAGVDSHVSDPLGGLLTTEQMRQRDALFFRFVARHGIPVAVSLAGGYQRDERGSIAPVLRLHDQTLVECWSAYANRPQPA
jgi:acetoin utilization deacetylase AcuC-like enzyme